MSRRSQPPVQQSSGLTVASELAEGLGLGLAVLAGVVSACATGAVATTAITGAAAPAAAKQIAAVAAMRRAFTVRLVWRLMVGCDLSYPADFSLLAVKRIAGCLRSVICCGSPVDSGLREAIGQPHRAC
jgi:hypothetical protein